jgi:hypothetical protein
LIFTDVPDPLAARRVVRQTAPHVDDRQEMRKSEPGRRKVQFFGDGRIMFRDSS